MTAVSAPIGKHEDIPIFKIVVSDKRRATRNVAELADSIRVLGLLNPITVTPDMRLVAGGNRLAACKSLGWETIPTTVIKLDRLQAELAEIDENLIRNELTALERGEQTVRRKALYLAIHPETGHGKTPGAKDSGAGGKRTRNTVSNRSDQIAKPITTKDAESASLLPLEDEAEEIVYRKNSPRESVLSFVEDTAKKTGQSPRAVFQDVQFASSIVEDVRDKIRNTPLADRKTDLLKIARLEADQQQAVVTKVIETPTLTVSQALRAVAADVKRVEMQIKADAIEAESKDDEPTWEVIEGDCIEVLESCIEGQPGESQGPIDRESVRLIFADPPYNIGVDYGDHHDDSMAPDDFVDWCHDWIEASSRLLTPDGSMWVLINHEWAAHLELILGDVGLSMRDWITWYEPFGVNCSTKFNRCSRRLLHAVKNSKKFVFNRDAVTRVSDRQEMGDKRADPGGKVWDDVWGIKPRIDRLVDNAKERVPDFPTQLPLALLRPIIGCASDPGDLVLDPFNGSGTTGAACIELGRRYVGIEKSGEFARVARMRLKTMNAKVQEPPYVLA